MSATEKGKCVWCLQEHYCLIESTCATCRSNIHNKKCVARCGANVPGLFGDDRVCSQNCFLKIQGYERSLEDAKEKMSFSDKEKEGHRLLREAEKEKKEEEKHACQEIINYVAEYMGAEAGTISITPGEQTESILSLFNTHRPADHWNVFKLKRDGHVIRMKPIAPVRRNATYGWYIDDKPLFIKDQHKTRKEPADDQEEAQEVYHARLLLNEGELDVLIGLADLSFGGNLHSTLSYAMDIKRENESRQEAVIRALKEPVTYNCPIFWLPITAEKRTVYYINPVETSNR